MDFDEDFDIDDEETQKILMRKLIEEYPEYFLRFAQMKNPRKRVSTVI